jgi:hypothetical protein
LETIRFGRIDYRVERVKESETHLLRVRFVLHSPRGRRYLLVPDRRRPDRLVAIAPITHFAPFRPTPFNGTWFEVEENGTLVVAPPDA